MINDNTAISLNVSYKEILNPVYSSDQFNFFYRGIGISANIVTNF